MVVPGATPGRTPSGPADITATRPSGTVIAASYVTRTRAVSWRGAIVRAWIAWHWLKRNGCFFPAVCSGASHWRAAASGDVT